MSHPRLVVAAVTSLVLGSVVLFSPGAATGAPAGAAAQKLSVHKVGTARLAGGHSAAPGAGELRPDGEAGEALKAVRNRSPRSRAKHTPPTPLSGINPTQTLAVARPATSGWRALNHYEQRSADNGNQYSLVPPDQALCAGNGQVFEGVNNAFRVYRTTGAPLTDVVSANQFLFQDTEFDRTTGVASPHQVGDPSCVYDAGSNRFFLTTYELVGDSAGNLLGPSFVDVAVSPLGSALGTWSVYKIDTTDAGGEGCPCFGDYPHLGTDANGLYITTNEFSTLGSAYNGAQVYAIDKAALAAGSATVPGAHFDTSDQDNLNGAVIDGYSLAPAVSAGTAYAPNTMYFLSSDADAGDTSVTSSQILQWKIANTSALTSSPGSLALTHVTVGVNPYAIAPVSDQKVGPTPLADCLNLTSCAKVLLGKPNRYKEYEYALDSNDTRMLQSAYADGKVWGALDTAVDVDHLARAGVAYYALDATSSRVAKQGTLSVAGAQNITYPALGVTSDGRAAMTFSLVGTCYYPSAAYATLTAAPNAPVSSIKVPGIGVGPDDSFGGYRAYEYNHPRWGDYSAASVVGGQVYLASEYIA
ncbi:hypothetical protein BH10ACT10_BH10ACT10_21610 [soil metagenome]